MIWLLPAAILGACLNSWRGGWTPFGPHWGVGLRRITIGIVLGIIMGAITLDWRAGLAGLALWGGLAPGWADMQDMGRVAGTVLGDVLRGTGRGLVLGLPTAVILFLGGYSAFWWPLAAGSAMGLVYLTAWSVWRDGWARGGWLDGPTRAAELAMGALMFGASVGAVG